MIKNKHPFFSIIIACYNAESTIRIAIDSVIAQTTDDWELIIVDDCSIDNSRAIISEYCDSDRRIKLYCLSSNQGQAAARNFAINYASGDWIAILDADDSFKPMKLKIQRDFVQRHANTKVVLVGTACDHYNECNEFLRTYKYRETSYDLKKNLLYFLAFPPHSSIIIKKSSLQELGGYSSIYLRSEDYQLFLRLQKIGEFACINIPLLNYTVHEKSVTYNTCRNGYMQAVYSIAALLEFNLNIKFAEQGQSDLLFSDFLCFVNRYYEDSCWKSASDFRHVFVALFRSGQYAKAFISSINNLNLLFLISAERIKLYSFIYMLERKYKQRSTMLCVE